MAPPDRPVFPPPVEPDESEDEEEEAERPDPEADRRAQAEIEAIEREVDPGGRRSERAPRGLPRAEAPGKSFVDRAWDRQYAIEGRLRRIGHGRYSRVLRMARKPEHDEFVRASQITAIGIGVIGLVGFLIFLLTSWIWSLLGVR